MIKLFISVAGRVLETGRWSKVGKNLNRTLQCKLEDTEIREKNAKVSLRNSPSGTESGMCVDKYYFVYW